MENSEKKMPCPDCPPDCSRLCETCKVFCKIYKIWAKEHAAPRPRVSVNDAYAQQKHMAAVRRAKNGKR